MTSLRALRKGFQISRRFKLPFSESQKRFMGSDLYRVYPRPNHSIWTDALMTFAWSWLWYNLFTNYDKAYGHYWYPDPSKWTDEELGIPPMSEEDSTE